MRRPDAEQWRQAALEELNAHSTNGVSCMDLTSHLIHVLGYIGLALNCLGLFT